MENRTEHRCNSETEAPAYPEAHPPLSESLYGLFVDMLRRELVPATGCTEPIAIAYAAATAADALGCVPSSCHVLVSGNIVKNVNSVVVPNTGGLRGIKAAVAAGLVAGNADARLEVLAGVDDDGRARIADYLDRDIVTYSLADECLGVFYVQVDVEDTDGHTASAVMARDHVHLTAVKKDGKTVRSDDCGTSSPLELPESKTFNLHDILMFAQTFELDDLRDILDRQLEYNCAIAREGLTGDWGARIGKTYLSAYDADDVLVKAKAWAAAGSDARMSGCPLPVVIVSGSGNQGIAASVPVAVYAREYGKTHEELLRALVVSDLVSIYQKSGIGCLSAFCGAISAGTGAAAGIVFLMGGDEKAIKHTIVNSLGIISGMVCDGAKPSCAAKIAAAIETGVFGYRMYANGNQFYAGDGIVARGVDKTIANVSRMARDGMRQTDREILGIMIEG